jgi:predicted metalloprotease with PDZ domain
MPCSGALPRYLPFALLLALLAAPAWAAATTPPARPIELTVDATHAPQGIFHTREVIPIAPATPETPGPLTLAYPKWIQGEHTPTGPMMQVAGLTVTVPGTAGKPLSWRRDPVDMFLVRVDVPAGADAVEVQFDYLSPPASFGAGYGESVNTTPHLLIADWNDFIFYPLGAAATEIAVHPTLRLPDGWQWDSALRTAPGGGKPGEVGFATTTLYILLDAPVLAGDFFRKIEVGPQEWMSIAADRAASLAVPEERIAAYRRMPGEAAALFGTRRYGEYHWLVAASDAVDMNGIEHHESSDDRGSAELFTEETELIRWGILAPHEYIHAWNGKYRRPAGLDTRDPQEPLRTELLWIYEGLTRYLGDVVLTTRSGIRTPEMSREYVAWEAAILDLARPGRRWRSLADNSLSVQLLSGLPQAWSAYRRALDYYDEAMLIWLEADTVIRQKSGGQKSLDDFCRTFVNGAPPTAPYAVSSYAADDVYAALNALVPYDWRGFFAARVYEATPRVPLGGLEAAGWKLVYDEQPNAFQVLRSRRLHLVEANVTLGLWIRNDGTVNDVVFGSPAWNAGFGPSGKILTVGGRKWSPEAFAEEMKKAEHTTAPIEFTVADGNGDDVRTLRADYHGGIRWPHLVRDPTRPDLLTAILAPRTR